MGLVFTGVAAVGLFFVLFIASFFKSANPSTSARKPFPEQRLPETG